MKIPAWELWSSDTSWGVRELDTQLVREGAPFKEAASNTIHHLDMGCIPELSHTNDAVIVGQFLKDWAWRIHMPQLLEENREVEKLRRQVHSLGRRVHDLDAALRRVSKENE